MKEIIEQFKSGNGRLLPAIAVYLLKTGLEKVAQITDQDLEELKSDLKKKEEEAKKNNQVMLLGADFQADFIWNARHLARLRQNEGLREEVDLLLAQSLASQENYLSQVSDKDIQKEYIKRLAKEIIKAECTLREQKKIEEEDYLETIIDKTIADGELEDCLRRCIDYYIQETLEEGKEDR